MRTGQPNVIVPRDCKLTAATAVILLCTNHIQPYKMLQSCFSDQFLKTCKVVPFTYSVTDISNGAGTDCA